MTAARTLGIIDWGIGGLGLLRHLDSQAPRLPVIYWSDTAAVPYGKQRTWELSARLRAIVIELTRRGCTEVVLACHSASTVAQLLDDCPIPVSGIIEHAVRAVPVDLDGTIGVVGGRRTISSGTYRRALTGRGLHAISRVAQPLSAHIEAGRIGSPEFRRDLRRIVAPIRGAQALMLACTHYPAAAGEFAAALPGTLLIDPAAAAAVAIAGAPSSGRPHSRTFLTTGDVHAMTRAARLAWGYRIDRVSRVDLASSRVEIPPRQDPLGEDVNLIDVRTIRSIVHSLVSTGSTTTSPTPALVVGATTTPVVLDVVNATTHAGLSTSLIDTLGSGGLTPGEASTADALADTSSIVYGPGAQDAAGAVADQFHLTANASASVAPDTVRLVVGADFPAGDYLTDATSASMPSTTAAPVTTVAATASLVPTDLSQMNAADTPCVK